MQRIFFILIIFSQIVLSAQSATLVRFLDIWSGRPVPEARLVMAADTLRSNKQGVLFLRFDCNTGSGVFSVKARGYFDEQVSCRELQDGIIYLTPIGKTEFITVVRPKIHTIPLNIPSHQTHIALKDIPIHVQSIADVLQEQSGIFIKPYGPSGNLISVAVRGMTAEQTQVLFDGIPLNNVQLGSADLSQISVTDLAGLDVYRGSNVLLGGSGAIGGSINLQPMQPAGRIKLSGRVWYSSLKNKTLGVRLHFPWPKIHVRTLLTFDHANGLNHYSTQSDGKRVWLRDRDFRQHNVSYQAVFDGLENTHIKLYVSHFKRNGGAPGAFSGQISEDANRARLTTDNTFAYLRYLHRGAKTEFSLQTYLRNEWMTYNDPKTMINFKPLHSIHFDRERGLQGRFHYSPCQRILFKSGIELSQQTISSSNAGNHQRRRYAAYLLSDWKLFEKVRTLQAFHLNGGLRVEGGGNIDLQFLPAVGINFNWRHTQVYASAGKNVRIPGFNDLYWQPGGNPNLKPEYARNLEAGVRQNILFARWLGHLEVSVYRNRVRDQIRWMPGHNGIWSPQNIRSIKSTGLEFDARLEHVNGIHRLEFNYSFGKSVKEAAEFAGDNTVGNQVPFLPQEQWSLTIQSGFSRWRMGMMFRHTGFRYLDFSNDPAQILPSFTVASLFVNSRFSVGKLRLQPALSVENVFDKHYQVLKGFPMPGRYFSIGVKMEL